MKDYVKQRKGGLLLKSVKDIKVVLTSGLKVPEFFRSTAKKPGATKVRKGYKKGGNGDDNWIQEATKNMRKDKPCTGKKFGSETCPPGSKRYNLAKTFSKK